MQYDAFLIADNTLPNIGVMLTNSFISDDYKTTCVKNGSSKGCDFIWKYFAEKGYHSVHVEDEYTMGLFPHLGLGGTTISRKTAQAPEYFYPMFLRFIEKYLG